MKSEALKQARERAIAEVNQIIYAPFSLSEAKHIEIVNKNNDELIDMFCDALKDRMKSGEIKFTENNDWLQNPNFRGIELQIDDSYVDGNFVDTAIYGAFYWYHKGNDLGD